MAAPPIPALNVTSSCDSAPPTSTTQYFLPGCRPVAAICRLSIGPNELIATLACAADVTPGRGVNSTCSACAARPRGPKLDVPLSEATAFGTYTNACGSWPTGMVARH